MRTPADSPKRRVVPKAPLPSVCAAKKAPGAPAVAAATKRVPHKTLLDAVGEEVANIRSRQEGPAEPAQPGSPPRRAKRAAAVKAASRALEFATTGEWPADDDEDCTIPITALRKRGSPSKEEHNSDSAEEETWGPAGMRAPRPVAPHLALRQQVGGPPPPLPPPSRNCFI